MKRLILLIAIAAAAFGQRAKLVVNAETPEGQLLQQIGQESEEAKKTGLLEQFAAKYPTHESAGWVYGQLQNAYLKANQFDKALEAGEKLLAIDPDDVETAHQNLKASEGRKDIAGIKKWSDQTAQIARKIVASPQPKEEDQVEEWKRKVEFSKQVITYTEYALYAAALQAQDAREQAGLIEALEQRNPNSEYLRQAVPIQFAAYLRAGDTEKAVTVAEKVLATDQSNEDMLLVAAGVYLDKKTNPDKIVPYTEKVIELVNTKPKPQGVADADWNQRKAQLSGRAYWIQGKHHFNNKKLAEADKSLRAALPLIEDQNLKADALFHLGLANYRMEKILDALRFNEQCAAIKSPYQAAAQKNIKAIRSQYREVR
ncbi:MAG: hypothetical protein IT158_19410 [Bryobacterales bacterium]|nr:hypothetical protein [Bryobacterales bacterium]